MNDESRSFAQALNQLCIGLEAVRVALKIPPLTFARYLNGGKPIPWHVREPIDILARFMPRTRRFCDRKFQVDFLRSGCDAEVRAQLIRKYGLSVMLRQAW